MGCLIMTSYLLLTALYVVCGVLAYGSCLAYYQREFPEIASETYKSNSRIALATGLFVPVFGVGWVVFCLIDAAQEKKLPFRHGLMFRNPHREDG